MDFKYIILGFVMTQMSSGSIPDVKTFFPQIENDLSLITWGHAINSMSLLEEAISDALLFKKKIFNNDLHFIFSICCSLCPNIVDFWWYAVTFFVNLF
ncbi:UNVERIFIED_CONTAM: hypothetical protein RMT77_019393 [Armadillidium vulgare]